MSPKFLYHITSATEWRDAQSQDYYCPTAFDGDRFLNGAFARARACGFPAGFMSLHDAKRRSVARTAHSRHRLLRRLATPCVAYLSLRLCGETPKTALYRFIHCSYAHQLLTVAHRFYRGEKGLVILVIESSKINGKLVEENLEGGTELYPHLYGVLPINAVSKAIAFPCNADGSFSLPEELTI